MRTDRVDWMFRAALLSYVSALLLVLLLFPGVSNLWVTVLILVSGFFNLAADYAAYRRERRKE